MPHALLLSPDDQAVNAITGVLEEMSVSCERPLDAISAAQDLNSHNFDLVLVDCENLPAAKLIFDVCRRSQGGNNLVPVAIVDGRAGLPTAFRLGAELILTKPVSKDQARSTIRTAVSRVRREEPVPAAAASDVSSVASASAPSEAPAQAVAAAATATAAAAATASPQRAKTTDGAAGIAEASSVPGKAKVAVKEAPGRPAASSPMAKPLFVSQPKTVPGLSPEPRAKVPDHPVLAQISKASKSEMVPEPPVLSSFDRPEPKKRGGMVTVLVLALAAGGFYAAWMYQPGFREIIQPQLDRVRVMDLAGLAMQTIARLHPTPAPLPRRGAPKPAPASPVAPQSGLTDQSTTGSTKATPTEDATGAGPTSAAAPASSSLLAGSASLEVAPDAGKATPDASAENEPAVDKSVVILSSRGAEKRLMHQVVAVYPKEAKAAGLEGTVVLKTFVDERGNVASVTPLEGHPILADSAMRAVKQWRYRPYARDGKKLPFQTLVIIDFPRP